MNIKTFIILAVLSLLVSCASKQVSECPEEFEQPHIRDGMFGRPQ